MILECVLVCVDYADFLRWTLPYNRHAFDRMVVVTAPHDHGTQRLCRHHLVDCVVTQQLHRDGAPFNKGAAINDGLASLNREEWVLLTDADMIMPTDLREQLEHTSLDPEMIYGTSRYLCPSYDAWIEFLDTGQIGAGWVHQRHRRSIGVGFFQLVHARSSRLRDDVRWYHEGYPHAGRSDREFLRRWPLERRGRLNNIVPIHLDSAPCERLGTNWRGRVTPPFGNS